MKVRFKKLHPNAVVPFKKYKEDFCYDVVATSEEEVAPNVWKYGIGLAFEIERGEQITTKQEIRFGGEPIRTITSIDTEHFVGQISLDLRPRSSVWKTGMVLSNCIGTIDELYRGEVSAIFYHVFTEMPRYRVGDRIGQIKLGITLPLEFEEADELGQTARGDGGYGSTGR
ncbi:MAG: dUTP diphosphatase [Candidatus Cryptobacteroides sp.]